MEYYAVGCRCAVNIESLQLPISSSEILKILFSKGFELLKIDVVELALQCVGKSIYRRGARLSEAPSVVDCSSLVKWVYGQKGVWLPRRSIQQREIGISVPIERIVSGDVVFLSGQINYYHSDPLDGVGHVGIATGTETIIHAAGKKHGVIESPLENFVRKGKFRGIRRYIPTDQNVLTLKTPPNREVETSDDIRWIVLQTLPRE